MASVHYVIPLEFLPDNDGVINHHSPPEQLEPDATLWYPILRLVDDMIPFVHCTRPSIRHLSSASSALRSTEQVVGVHDPLLPYLTLPTLYFCCQCGDGPKAWGNQPRCVLCQHSICSYCKPVK
ncbi:hypothetical protein BO83DRAFT_382535 [Aspergillus eucalypticola CBS 122712]|uniref:Uncharacterized protein n=1 Tax=Aspergillus eucalypticola (strain CBS 122712 / IBT 29274) TaxID=1448314 RepID=A0A317UNX2_ASPEC|nr:uncharacterized protein BO83DRAFT_382535 [Aspergillus eucalypticola CBS 122712]PWY63683.1 hypothetical protein BO83DRAFT_382535 [Aspergillus eucalypticola CBS 122712]